jgi:hypothetical protein
MSFDQNRVEVGVNEGWYADILFDQIESEGGVAVIGKSSQRQRTRRLWHPRIGDAQ